MPETLLKVLYEFPVASLHIPTAARFPTFMACLKFVQYFSIFSRTKSTTNSKVSGDILNCFTHKSWNKKLWLLYHILSNHDWSYSIIQYLRFAGVLKNSLNTGHLNCLGYVTSYSKFGKHEELIVI